MPDFARSNRLSREIARGGRSSHGIYGHGVCPALSYEPPQLLSCGVGRGFGLRSLYDRWADETKDWVVSRFVAAVRDDWLWPGSYRDVLHGAALWISLDLRLCDRNEGGGRSGRLLSQSSALILGYSDISDRTRQNSLSATPAR